MKNKIFKVLVAASLLLLVVFGYQLVNKSKVEKGSKSITITAIDQRIDPPVYLIESKEFNTNALYLGELLDEINQQEQTFSFTGNKTDMYGRMLVAIKDIKQDLSANHYWMYESSNNVECKAAGFCSGVDQLPIYDQDVFVFMIK